MFDFLKNQTVYKNKYRTHSEAVIISCYFNPQKSPYRTKAFNLFYESIKHLNHHIVECVIGDTTPELKASENISHIHTENLLWHKETLLNQIVAKLPAKYKYIFWVDADVLFTNLNWVVDGVEELKLSKIIQPFEYCVHLEKNETKPSFSMNELVFSDLPNQMNKRVWRSFCANFVTTELWKDENYNNHGHVGFAWGARREILEIVPLYDKALIGGADHIIAHAAANQINHCCITKSFTENIDEVNEWSRDFANIVNKKIGYVKGELYHIWHGDVEKRQYLKRVQEFVPKIKNITQRDKNGFYIVNQEDEQYMKNYFNHREVPQRTTQDDGFLESAILGYATDSTLLGTMMGGNVAGAMLGDMLNNSDDNKNSDNASDTKENVEFGGGQFGGGGGGGTWEDDKKDDVSSDSSSTDNDNFNHDTDNFS